MKLLDIIRADSEYVGRTHYCDVRSAFGTVAIVPYKRDEHEEIFLQGDDAATFISEGERLWNELAEVTHTEVWDHLAKPYIDCLS